MRSLVRGVALACALTGLGLAGMPAVAQQDAASAPAAARPASKQATLTLEGAEEPISLVAFDAAAAGFQLAFQTYVPKDMVAELTGAGRGRALRFIANFGGYRQERAYLEVALLPAGLNQAQAEAALLRAGPPGAPLRRVDEAARRFKWSLAEYGMSYRAKPGGRMDGVAALGQHGGRFFRLTVHHPAEYAGGLLPRLAFILDEWRWSDGSGL